MLYNSVTVQNAAAFPSLPEALSASALALRAVELVHTDTVQARGLARRALENANESRDFVAASIAERALGLVAREELALEESILHFRRAITRAAQAGDPRLAGQARVGIMASYAIGGRGRTAINEGHRALAELTGPDRSVAYIQLATVLKKLDRFDEALEAYRCAIPGLRDGGNQATLAKLYNNRGGVYFHRGALAAALADYEHAERVSREAGFPRMAATARENWGVVASRQGDLAAALAAFAEADDLREGKRDLDPLSLRDRAVVLLAARLVGEALWYLRQAVDALRSGQSTYLAEAQVLLAEAALLADDVAEARQASEEAWRLFVRQRRSAWAALARTLMVRSAWKAGERSASLLHVARRTADELAAAGFAIPAADARLLAAQIALELGKVGVARQELGIARRARRDGPVDLQTRAWHAEALLRLQDGNRRGAWVALHAGIRALDRHRTALAATDLRVHASAHGEYLTTLGISLAIEEADPGRVLAWTERCRAISQRPRPVHPPADPELANDLAQLRQTIAATHEAALAERPTGPLLARQRQLEVRIRDRARYANGPQPGSLVSPPTVEELTRVLGDRVLVELVEHGGVLYAVSLASGRARLVRLALRDEVLTEVEAVRFALRRVVSARGSQSSLDAAADAVRYGLKRLDGLLIEPLATDVEGRPIVVVPTAPLHAAPWNALPSLAGRPITVAPSAAIWYSHAADTEREREDQRVVLVAGPGLPHATREVTAIARWHPAAVRLTGRRATARAVAEAIDGADLVHLAAHGRFRSDNPLFSCVQLVDGPETVYDLQNVQRPPRTLVLSACESGVSDAHPGDELMGLTASLLTMGTVTVVASIGPVADDATRRLMLAFHAAVAKGSGPAEALASAQQRSADRSPRDLAAAASFVCFGAG